MPFYYDDFLKIWNYDECEHDQYVEPYYSIDKAITSKMKNQFRNRVEGAKFEPAVFNQNYERDSALARGVALD